MTILDEIAAYTKTRIEEAKKAVSVEALKEQAYALPKGDFAFEKALKKADLSFICECKKASPSKGIIAEEFPYLQIAQEYEAAGADCISVLTEPKWFLGKNEYVKEITDTVKIPVIRKDFTVDEYMIYEAKTLGASAVLLIVAILSKEQLIRYHKLCDELGLSALVETHDEKEVEMAVSIGARIIGVNNRNLKDFSVDLNNARRLRSLIPADRLYVAESGIRGPEDSRVLKASGVNAVLIGEAMMKAPDRTEFLRKMREASL